MTLIIYNEMWQSIAGSASPYYVCTVLCVCGKGLTDYDRYLYKYFRL